MTSSVLVFVVSTLTFCLCLRGFMVLAFSGNRTLVSWNRRFGFSSQAWRLAYSYVRFALLILATAAFAGVVKSFIELFQL